MVNIVTNNPAPSPGTVNGPGIDGKTNYNVKEIIKPDSIKRTHRRVKINL